MAAANVLTAAVNAPTILLALIIWTIIFFKSIYLLKWNLLFRLNDSASLNFTFLGVGAIPASSP